MTLQEIIDHINLQVLTESADFSQVTPTGGYSSDLLSCVMAGAKTKNIWITLQCHGNIVAVAALLDLSAIIITEGAQPDQNTINKANEQNIVLLSTPMSTYQTIGKLWDLGVRT